MWYTYIIIISIFISIIYFSVFTCNGINYFSFRIPVFFIISSVKLIQFFTIKYYGFCTFWQRRNCCSHWRINNFIIVIVVLPVIKSIVIIIWIPSKINGNTVSWNNTITWAIGKRKPSVISLIISTPVIAVAVTVVIISIIIIIIP